MKKILLLLLLFMPMLVLAEDINLSIGDRTITVESEYPKTIIVFEDYRPIGLMSSAVNSVLRNIDLMNLIFEEIDSNQISVPYSARARSMYLNHNGRLKLVFRIHIREDGSYHTSISLVDLDEVFRLFITPEELEQFRNALENSQTAVLNASEQYDIINEVVHEVLTTY